MVISDDVMFRKARLKSVKVLPYGEGSGHSFFLAPGSVKVGGMKNICKIENSGSENATVLNSGLKEFV